MVSQLLQDLTFWNSMVNTSRMKGHLLPGQAQTWGPGGTLSEPRNNIYLTQVSPGSGSVFQDFRGHRIF